MADSLGRERRLARQIREDNAVVYYVRVGDLVKIGTTTDLKKRMNGYPPHSHLLATEQGGLALESRRHDEFHGDLAAGNEWFTPSVKLMAHIASIEGNVA